MNAKSVLFAVLAGVASVSASLEKKEAVVTFDDTKTTVEGLTKATADAGFRSTRKP
jgi:mercuric ion binding protein